jgi:hypothetical protein
VAPIWQRLIASLPFNEDDRVLVVSLNGMNIPRLLIAAATSRSVAYVVMEPKYSPQFILATGMNATPLTVALDEGGRVRRVISPRRLEAARASLEAFFSRPAR